MEMEPIRFTKDEVAGLMQRVLPFDCSIDEMQRTLNFLIKLGVISEYIFASDPKDKK